MEATPHPRAAGGAWPRPAAWIGTSVIAACWAVLRLAMNREYAPANWMALVELRAPLPFGHRVLVPLLARPFVDAGVPVAWVFGVAEWLATITLVFVLRSALLRDLPPRAAAIGAIAVLPVLAFPMLLAHRWNVFYPWDTWAMVAIVLGVDAARRDRFGWACVVVFVGALNRESIALVPLFAVMLHLERPTRRTAIAWAVWMAFAYAAARGLVAAAMPEARGAPLHLWLGDEPRLLANLRWLGQGTHALHHALQWFGSIACLPLAWWLVRSWAPRELVRLHVPAVIGMLGLVVVANVYEPRVYGELVVIAWWVVWTGAWRWVTDDGAVAASSAAPWIAAFDRVAAVSLVAIAAMTAWVAWG